MFVAWQERPLSARGFHREGDWCPHAAGTPGRDVVLVPLVSVSERVDGKARRRVVHRFGQQIRPCCIEEREAPQARLAFWRSVEASWARAAPHVLLERERLTAQLVARVPLPTADERAVWEAYCSGVSYPYDADRRTCAVRGWAAGRERLALFRQRRRRGESFADWNEREPGIRWARVNLDEEPAPAPSGPPACFVALGLSLPCSADAVRAAWKRLAAAAHPDRGGSHAAFVALGQARDEALAWLARAA